MRFLAVNILLITIFFSTSVFAQEIKKDSQPAGYDEVGRVLTLNNMGWMHPVIDEITAEFLKYCKQHQGAHVLEIGASYGYASQKALALGANVWINDLDPRHLEVFQKKITNQQQRARMTLVPGDFPAKPLLKEGNYDAILAVRVLHFFAPLKLEEAAKQMFKLLKKGGKIYVVADTPYLKNWAKYIPVYEAKKSKGDLFPGYFTNPADYNEENAKYLPSALHFLDPEVLTRVFVKVGFKVEKAVFLNRSDYPEKIRLDGRESVGFIAFK